MSEYIRPNYSVRIPLSKDEPLSYTIVDERGKQVSDEEAEKFLESYKNDEKAQEAINKATKTFIKILAKGVAHEIIHNRDEFMKKYGEAKDSN